MKTIYDHQPEVLEAVGNGSHRYHYDIKEVTVEDHTGDGEAVERTQWECEEALVWEPVTANRITEAVISDRWDSNYEQKLVNEYNAAQLGVYGAKTSDEAKARIQAYTDFLKERNELKAQVDADCETLGIN